MNSLPSTYEVSTFRRQGYLVEAAILEAERAESWTHRLEAAVGEAVPSSVHPTHQRAPITNGVAVAERTPAAAEVAALAAWCDLNRQLAADTRLLTWVGALLGSPPRLVSSVARLRTDAADEAGWWRQESAQCSPAPSRMVCVWLALDDVTEESGCLVVLPRSHQDGLLRHTRRQGQWYAEATRQAATSRPGGGYAVPLPAGGAVFYDGRLLTASVAGRPACQQRALQLNYVPADEELGPRV